MTLRLRSIAHSEIGLVRKNNQDSGLVTDAMICVADGMGGAAAGDLASAVAIKELQKIDLADGAEPETALNDAMDQANETIAQIVNQNPDYDGMGTTVCGGILRDHQLSIVHIGDSRGYLYRDGALTRITHDHSYVQSLIDEGKLDEDEAITHPHRSLLLRVLNGQSYVEPEFFSIPLTAGDRIMFCSDGLCGLVPDEVIAALIANPVADEAMTGLIKAAHDASGSDNITIIISDVSETTTPELTTPDGLEPTLVAPHTGDDEEQQPLPISQYVTAGVLGAAANPNVTRFIPRLRTKRRDIDLASAMPSQQHPREKRKTKRSYKWLIAIIAAVVVVIVGVGAAVYSYGTHQFYVAESDGEVAIYQGIPGDVLGLTTHKVYETTTIRLTDLPLSYADRVVSGIDSGGLDQARNTVHELQVKSEECLATRADRPAGSSPGPDGC